MVTFVLAHHSMINHHSYLATLRRAAMYRWNSNEHDHSSQMGMIMWLETACCCIPTSIHMIYTSYERGNDTQSVQWHNSIGTVNCRNWACWCVLGDTSARFQSYVNICMPSLLGQFGQHFTLRFWLVLPCIHHALRYSREPKLTTLSLLCHSSNCLTALCFISSLDAIPCRLGVFIAEQLSVLCWDLATVTESSCCGSWTTMAFLGNTSIMP